MTYHVCQYIPHALVDRDPRDPLEEAVVTSVRAMLRIPWIAKFHPRRWSVSEYPSREHGWMTYHLMAELKPDEWFVVAYIRSRVPIHSLPRWEAVRLARFEPLEPTL